jgi:hypothetical protein
MAEPMYGSDPLSPPDGGGMGEDAPAELDDFGMAIQEAFPDNDWTPARLGAMKEAIRLCLDKDEAGEYGDEEPKSGKGLALIFGGPEKKK